jgi:hypothetical protein
MAISDISTPFSLVEVFLFDEMMQNMDKDSSDLQSMVCVGVYTQQPTACSFLIACHRIMSGSFGFEEAFLALQPPEEQNAWHNGSAGIKNSLRAISCARCLNWIDFGAESAEVMMNKDCIKMHEHIHYSRYIAQLMSMLLNSFIRN